MRGKRKAVIAVSGPHGSGKSTCAHALAQKFGLRYVSAGDLFKKMAKKNGMSLIEFSKLCAKDSAYDRLVDDATKREAEAGGVVLDSQLGAWLVKDIADVKVLITASPATRYARLARRDEKPLKAAVEETKTREDLQRKRFKKYYGIDVDDTRIYDVKVDSGGLTSNEVISTVANAVGRRLNGARR